MTNLPASLHNQPITRLAIPGTHDSFAFRFTTQAGPDLAPNLRRLRLVANPIIRRWSTTQNKNFTEQLNIGIRYFDLRVCPTTDKGMMKKSLFTFTHGLVGDSVRHSLEEINQFLDAHSHEVVLLDFNHFYDFNDQCGHEQLIHLIHEVFGTKLCTTARTIEECTLSYLWDHHQQVILLYEQHADQCSAYMDRVGHFFKVCDSPWPNTPRVNDLFVFLDKKVATTRRTTCINVVQGQVTPDGAAIQSSPLSSLWACAIETNQRLIAWLALRQRDPSQVNGVNVVICDFADELFTNAVIMLNYKGLPDISVQPS